MPSIEISWIRLEEDDAGVLNRFPTAIQVPEGSSIESALALLGYNAEQIQDQIQTRGVSIFGQYATPGVLLHPGDRIEILDKLRFNPMESRRRRAAHKNQRSKGVRKSGLASPK